MARIKLIVLFISVFISRTALCCYVPYDGPKYDSLISIESLGLNNFKVVVPKKAVDNHFGAFIEVAYYEQGREGRFVEYKKTYYKNKTMKIMKLHSI